jgi:hypothetical protein
MVVQFIGQRLDSLSWRRSVVGLIILRVPSNAAARPLFLCNVGLVPNALREIGTWDVRGPRLRPCVDLFGLAK